LPMPDMPGRRALRRWRREVGVDAKGSPTRGYSGTARAHVYCVTLISSKLNLINHVPFAAQRGRMCRRQFLSRKAPPSAPCGPSTTFALASQNAPSQDLRASEQPFQDPSFVASINGGQARNLPAVRHVALPPGKDYSSCPFRTCSRCSGGLRKVADLVAVKSYVGREGTTKALS
jgi:hypothetical protein